MNEVRCASYADDDLVAWVLGDMAGGDECALAEHLSECPTCRDRTAEYRRLEQSATACRKGDVIRWRRFESPFGEMRIAASRRGLVELSWQTPSDGAFVERLEARYGASPVVCDCDDLVPAQRQLLEYFERRRRAFDVPVDLGGLTEFQRSVLQAARGLGFGEVATYADIARRIGRPNASRAVGNALGSNPVAIVVPCHRVVRSDGTLGGYTGGLEYKEALLGIEGRSDLLGPPGLF
ncbi:MAG: methylated-DNA--[protein]-cysteine S-methyltransferase [Gemmatimonadota bacterium]|nr:methylated-DNA--[protein]-cysteine S-methyltransferase [Gemmatimonadota bacterium]